MLRYFDADGGEDCRLLLVNLGRDLFPNPTSEPLLAPPPGQRWPTMWYSEHPRYGGCGAPPYETDNHWRIPGHSAIVLVPTRRGPSAEGRPRLRPAGLPICRGCKQLRMITGIVRRPRPFAAPGPGSPGRPGDGRRSPIRRSVGADGAPGRSRGN